MAKDLSFDATMWTPLDANEALHALDLALHADHGGHSVVTIAAINQLGAHQLTQRHPALRSMFAPVLVASPTSSPPGTQGGVQMASSTPRAFSVDDVLAISRKYATTTEGEALRAESPIVELGLDSLGPSALPSELGQAFEADVGLATLIQSESFTELFDSLLDAGSSAGCSTQDDLTDTDDDDEASGGGGRRELDIMTLVQLASGYASHAVEITTQTRMSEAGFDSLALGSFAAELTCRSGIPCDLITLVDNDALEDLLHFINSAPRAAPLPKLKGRSTRCTMSYAASAPSGKADAARGGTDADETISILTTLTERDALAAKSTDVWRIGWIISKG